MNIRRVVIILLLILSLFIGVKYFYLYNSLYNNTKNFKNLIKTEKSILPGIYLVYPLDGSACDTCIFNLCLTFKKFYREKIKLLIPYGLPDRKFQGSNIVNIVKYHSINPLLDKKVVFVNKNGEITFLCNISYLISGKKQNIKNIIYCFKAEF